MASIQERLQIKREPLDKWSVREQLCLSFAVSKSGDQNWMSVSRMLKPFGEPNRPVDWFHQKNCAAQYGSLLENIETPKRKKRVSGLETTVETPIEAILRKLTNERIEQLDKCLLDEKLEYAKLQEDMALLQSGNVSEELLDKWCKEIDDEEKLKEEETVKHAQWLKEREQRKQEIERAWRPFSKIQLNVATKRKISDSSDSLMDVESQEEAPNVQPETTKPALSPLLTSLLKSPSQVQGVVTSSILHSAITSQRQSISAIASLLSTTSSDLNVQPSLPPLSSAGVLQDSNVRDQTSSELMTNDLLQEAVDSLPNIKVEDFESSMLSSDEPLPEMKNEEVEVIISDLIQNADIVSDPEQHLHLSDNDDIITNLDNELQVLCNEEKAAEEAAKEKEAEKNQQKIDPFEFEEDPDISEIPKPTSSSTHSKYQESVVVEDDSSSSHSSNVVLVKETPNEDKQKERHESLPGSVEIVEVVVMEETEIDKQLNKTQIQDIVHSVKVDVGNTYDDADTSNSADDVHNKQAQSEDSREPTTSSNIQPVDDNKKSDGPEISHSTLSSEFSESFFDDLTMEVNKLDKLGKAKRDYSRTKKRETEKDFDILLAVEKAVNAEYAKRELPEELSDKEDQDDKKPELYKPKIKIETDRSSSPWTEEEEISTTRSRRRYSNNGTPIDSVPNSPASSSAYCDDDREHRNWKKSVMLLYSRLTMHKCSSLFLRPITNDVAPGYHNSVYRPMDLQTLRKNIESGVVRTTQELQRDILLMFNNAIMFNKTNGAVYSMAQQMQLDVLQQLEIFVQAQHGDLPQRRETRTSEPTNKRKRTSEDANLRVKKRKDD